MTDLSWLGPRIDVRPLFAGWQAAFVGLLRELDGSPSGADGWNRATACPGWSVQDVAAHVLGDHVGRLSMVRDGHWRLQPGPDEPFPRFIDRVNEEWVTAARRMSPRVLVDLLDHVGDEIVAHWRGADIDALGGPVSWAGPEEHPVWLDAARDFTEYWTHHQQIRDALGLPGLAEHVGVVLDTFMRALPHTMRAVDAPAGTSLAFTVTGHGTWTCARTAERWALRDDAGAPDARVELDADSAWRLCTRGITPDEAAGRARTGGHPALVSAALSIVSIIR
ncbi:MULTISPECIES: maleylpyruvate isomerase family mycothiol-dependent enzyme [Actinomadura]|uniref:Maleylpyruvate isomerase family mycothiol-dependent enzyme n=1 Tax=Actinomadura yumaensis TaxID=111807 RepID=A0ABW2CX27_9ACTN|nr:maleylpyruvate isomerase family mycothiol-dependent enzyme [Actinomadura sp. J1-007]MWK38837.1 maleylpyruvate isomerase family mycothiol-dependent enzyme [Actinomadura sp. J1-007]